MSRTPQTQAKILQLLKHHHILSAPQIENKLADARAEVNKTTVYRALQKLVDSDQICKQIFSEDILMYELRNDHHDHLVCETCGNVEVTDCTTDTPKTIQGFLVNHHHTTIFGTCKTCLH